MTPSPRSASAAPPCALAASRILAQSSGLIPVERQNAAPAGPPSDTSLHPCAWLKSMTVHPLRQLHILLSWLISCWRVGIRPELPRCWPLILRRHNGHRPRLALPGGKLLTPVIPWLDLGILHLGRRSRTCELWLHREPRKSLLRPLCLLD